MKKKHIQQKKYLKIPKDIWDEVTFLLHDAENHLDLDFDFKGSDEYEMRVKKLLAKLDDLEL